MPSAARQLTWTLERELVKRLLDLPPPLLARIVGAPPKSAEGVPVDLQLYALVFLGRVLREPPIHALPLARARRGFERLMRAFDLPPASDVVATDRLVQGDAGPLRARVYTKVPSDAADARARPGPMAAIVWFHGGGFTLGSIESHDGACRALASRAGVLVLSIDYRLAPEHPFPAAPDDAIAATRWVLEHAEGLGIDPAAVAVGGDSAGGCLAAVVARALRDDRVRPAFQVLVYPATDARRGAPSHGLFSTGFLLERGSIDWFMKCYLPDPQMRASPRASPLLEQDLRRLPPALVVTAGFDPLRDEGDEYAAKMAAQGVSVEHVRLPTMMHGFFSLAGVVRDADQALHRIARSLREGLARSAMHVTDPSLTSKGHRVGSPSPNP